MAGRGQLPPGYVGHSDQAPELAVQEAEIERLERDNQILASADFVGLRHDIVASKQEIQRLRAHIESTPREADMRIRVLLEKIAKLEPERAAGESIKEDLLQAHTEGQDLLKTNQEVSGRTQQAHQELEKARADIKRLHEMQSQLQILKKEHQSVRTTFEFKKGRNMEKVETLKVMEKDLITISRERDNLRAQLVNSERRARVPNRYDGAPSDQDPAPPRRQ